MRKIFLNKRGSNGGEKLKFPVTGGNDGDDDESNENYHERREQNSKKIPKTEFLFIYCYFVIIISRIGIILKYINSNR